MKLILDIVNSIQPVKLNNLKRNKTFNLPVINAFNVKVSKIDFHF